MLRQAALPLIILGISISAFAMMDARGQRIEQALSPAFGNLAVVRTVEIVDTSEKVLLSGVFETTSEDADETERSAQLIAPNGSDARGTAEIEIARRKRVVIRDEIELTAEMLPIGTTCRLLVDGQQVSEFTTTKKGRVDLKLSRKVSPRK